MLQKKNCESCGCEFTCSGDNACWCGEYSVSDQNLREIRRRFHDCLCPECLSRFAGIKKAHPIL